MTDKSPLPPVGLRRPTRPGVAAVRRALLLAAVGAVLLLVFAAYLRPAMAFQMAQQLWSCF